MAERLMTLSDTDRVTKMDVIPNRSRNSKTKAAVRDELPELRQLSWGENSNEQALFGKEQEEPDSGLGTFILDFDTNYKEHSLPRDWHNLRFHGKDIGFSILKQMDLLENAYDSQAKEKWIEKTRMDLVGFKLEYLTNHLVYPAKYTISETDPTRLESKDYGNVAIEDTISEDERGGWVKDSARRMKEFLLDEDTPDGAMAVMSSPLGPTGLYTDSGKAIIYPDSYFFIMQRKGDTVTNYTVKTDFTLNESRKAVTELTGNDLPIDARVEDFVRTVAFLQPGEKDVRSVNDVIRVLETVRPERAFRGKTKVAGVEVESDISWDKVYKDIHDADRLYEFDTETNQIIDEFTEYAAQDGLTEEELQKGIAATILRMSLKYDQEERDTHKEVLMKRGVWSPISREATYGGAMDAVASKPGCAGGGGGSSSGGGGGGGAGGATGVATIGGFRSGRISNEVGMDDLGSLKFDCPHCGEENTRLSGTIKSECDSCEENVRC
jgi:hypothetical protein